MKSSVLEPDKKTSDSFQKFNSLRGTLWKP